MPVSYQHWDEALTTRQMFGDVAAVCELAEVFLEQHHEILLVLDDPHAGRPRTSDVIHTLRSLYGIFNASDAYAVAVEMDRHVRGGWEMTAAERLKMASQLREVAAELQQFFSEHQS